MEQLADVVIVSAFGRGNWLASELATRGWNVSLIDVSEKMGVWDPEDAETPFGLFETSDLVLSQKARLTDEGETLPVPNGLTVWLNDGPIEFRSELSSFQLERRQIPRVVESYLRAASTNARDAVRLAKSLKGLAFDDAWLAHFAHQLASTVYSENHRGVEFSVAAPIFTPFTIRRPSKAGWQKGLKACQAAGVKVRSYADVRDLRLAGKLFDAVEVHDERSGVERGRSLIWALTSGETARLRGSTFETLFPKGETKPSWYWTRFQVEAQGRIFAEQLPPHAIMIEDLCLPWTHANFLVVRKSSRDKCLDVWMRIPAWARTEKDYFESLRVKMEKVLEKKLPQAAIHTTVMPVETRVALDKLGPPRWPVFEPGVLSEYHYLKSPNIFFDGPENWMTLDWLGMYRHQNTILEGLDKLKAQWDAAARKAAMAQGSPST